MIANAQLAFFQQGRSRSTNIGRPEFSKLARVIEGIALPIYQTQKCLTE
jgi:hypothetical protein